MTREQQLEILKRATEREPIGYVTISGNILDVLTHQRFADELQKKNIKCLGRYSKIETFKRGTILIKDGRMWIAAKDVSAEKDPEDCDSWLAYKLPTAPELSAALNKVARLEEQNRNLERAVHYRDRRLHRKDDQPVPPFIYK